MPWRSSGATSFRLSEAIQVFGLSGRSVPGQVARPCFRNAMFPALSVARGVRRAGVEFTQTRHGFAGVAIDAKLGQFIGQCMHLLVQRIDGDDAGLSAAPGLTFGVQPEAEAALVGKGRLP